MELAEGVEKIGDEVFMGCDQLSIVTIPASVEQIGKHAFGYLEEKVSSWGASVGYTRVKDFTIIGKRGSEAERYAKANRFYFKDIDEDISELEALLSSSKVQRTPKVTQVTKPATLEEQIATMLKKGSGITVGSVVSALSKKYDTYEVCKAMCEYLKDQYLV